MKKYEHCIIKDGIRYCRVEGCPNKAMKNQAICSKHRHQRRKELAIAKLFNKL